MNHPRATGTFHEWRRRSSKGHRALDSRTWAAIANRSCPSLKRAVRNRQGRNGQKFPANPWQREKRLQNGCARKRRPYRVPSPERAEWRAPGLFGKGPLVESKRPKRALLSTGLGRYAFRGRTQRRFRRKRVEPAEQFVVRQPDPCEAQE